MKRLLILPFFEKERERACVHESMHTSMGLVQRLRERQDLEIGSTASVWSSMWGSISPPPHHQPRSRRVSIRSWRVSTNWVTQTPLNFTFNACITYLFNILQLPVSLYISHTHAYISFSLNAISLEDLSFLSFVFTH